MSLKDLVNTDADGSSADRHPAVPRLAFLGFCDRLANIRAGHPLLWHTNVIGISMTRVSHIFPLNLNGDNLLAALYDARSGETFKLLFRSKVGLQPFQIDVTVEVEANEIVPGESAASVIESRPDGLLMPGWGLVANAISTDVMVNEPGEYEVFYCAGESEQFLGRAVFAHATVPPLSSEDIAAIRSDPLGAKQVRVTVTCKICGDSLKAYAGLERQESAEKEGWAWNLEIQKERFICGCGKTNFSLVPIRTGLHGMLRRNLSASAGPQISMVRQYEQSALEEHCRSFRRLVDSNPGEETIQRFLENHPIFFHLFVPEKLMFKSPVLTKYFVDFAIVNNRKELLLVEIEKPSLRLLKKDGGVTADLQHALDQVRSWLRLFNDHKAAALDGLNLKLDEVAKIKGVVIAGRKPKDEGQTRILRSTSWGDIEVFTYDDLLRSVAEIVKQVASV